MRVNIEAEQKTQVRGLIFKKTIPYVRVTVHVQFTEEELTIIRDNDLGEMIVLERDTSYLTFLMYQRRNEPDPYPDTAHLRIKRLVKGPEYHDFQNMAEANAYRADLEEALRKLKEFLNQNAAVREPTSFEL